MKEANGNLWEIACDVRCVTTNGTVIDGEATMGAGCALEARAKTPRLPLIYGGLIDKFGNHVYLIKNNLRDCEPLVMFPVKHEVYQSADPELIMRSCLELTSLADIYGWQTILLPRPGCGHGKLEWGDVKPMIAPLLDDRVTVVTF